MTRCASSQDRPSSPLEAQANKAADDAFRVSAMLGEAYRMGDDERAGLLEMRLDLALAQSNELYHRFLEAQHV